MPLKYTSVEDLTDLLSETQLAQITDDSDGDPSTDDPRVQKFLAYAESTVDTFIQARYSLPLSPVPASVQYAALVIAKYRLLLRREYMSDEIEKEYMAVMTWLEMVRDDRADLYPRATDDDAEITSGTSVNTFFGPDWFVQYGFSDLLITSRP